MKISELKPFYYRTFRIEELENYFKQPVSSIRMQLYRWCKNKKLIRLKKNRYTFSNFHPNAFVIGQEMICPSYYSLESVLFLHGIIPEGPSVYTLITSKKTQQYTNEFGTYNYRHLPPLLFFGVEKREDGVWMAVPEKALIDYLYLNSKKFKSDFEVWKEERFGELDILDWKRMEEWATKYGRKKLNALVQSLHKYMQSEEYQSHR